MYLIQLHLSLETSKGDPSSHFHRIYFKSLQDSDLVMAACEWEIPQGFCTALLPIPPLYSCSKGCPRGRRLPAWQEGQAGVRTYGGLSHFRCLKRTPVPHVRLHMLHGLHMLQSPSTCSGMGVLLTHSPARHHCKASTLAQPGKKPWPCTGGLLRMSEGLQQVHI